MNYDDRVYFTAGDVVKMKQAVPNKPTMVVKSVDKLMMPGEGKTGLLGITCIWFNTIGDLQSHRFSTKDLEHVEK